MTDYVFFYLGLPHPQLLPIVSTLIRHRTRHDFELFWHSFFLSLYDFYGNANPNAANICMKKSTKLMISIPDYSKTVKK
jgi:hypothetical protein